MDHVTYGGRRCRPPYLFLNNENTSMSDELTLLKAQADTLGIEYSNNIGVESLKKRIAAKLNPETEKAGEGDGDGKAGDKKAPKVETEQERSMRIREEQRKDQLKLVRCRIANMNPAKGDLKGEIITVGNKYLGTIKKLVPFGEAGESYHLPRIMVDELKSREFNQVRTRKGDKGQTIIEQRLVKEYNIVELEPLTEKELADLARQQAAAAGL